MLPKFLPSVVSLFILVALTFVTVEWAETQTTQPTAASTPTIGIPEIAPPTWRQEDWNARRARCQQLFAESMARQQMTHEQLKNVRPYTSSEHQEFISCLALTAPPSRSLAKTGQTHLTQIKTQAAYQRECEAIFLQHLGQEAIAGNHTGRVAR